MPIDTTVFEFIDGLSGKFTALDYAGIFFARVFPLLILGAFLVFLILEPDWKVRFRKFALALLAVILSRWIIVEAIQFFYHRVRPPVALNFESLIPVPTSPSFPSGHAAIFFALGAAVFLLNRRWGLWFLFAACLMGVARIFVGVHYPSDILAGAIIGIFSALVLEKFFPSAGEKS